MLRLGSKMAASCIGMEMLFHLTFRYYFGRYMDRREHRIFTEAAAFPRRRATFSGKRVLDG
jgi:hypothetical protein